MRELLALFMALGACRAVTLPDWYAHQLPDTVLDADRSCAALGCHKAPDLALPCQCDHGCEARRECCADFADECLRGANAKLLASPPAAWCTRRRLLLAFHKSGSMIAVEAASVLNDELLKACAAACG